MSKCLAIKNEYLDKAVIWRTLVGLNNDGIKALFLEKEDRLEVQNIIEKYGVFLERYGKEGVEGNPDFQQVISYCIIKKNEKFLVYLRGDKGNNYAEERIAKKVSIGIGGHVDRKDVDLRQTVERRLNQELNFSKKKENIKLLKSQISFIGLIKDNRDEVGREHIGLVYSLELADEIEVDIKLAENTNSWFVTYSELMHNYVFKSNSEYKVEGWTEIILDRIVPYLFS